MCWNPDISINTFIFSSLALLFIYFSNTYTKYKVTSFENPAMYLIIISFTVMQLLEYFLWKNLKNNKMNEFLSKIGLFIIFFQPITLMIFDYFEFKNLWFTLGIIFLYILFWIGFILYKNKYNPFQFITSIGKNGHLKWDWLIYPSHEMYFVAFLYFFYIIYSFFFMKTRLDNYYKFIFFVSIFITYVYYFKTNEFSSMFCWLINFILLYILIIILIIKPFYEYNGLC
jgi:hypothetical protein